MNACRSPLLTERFIPVKRLEILFLSGRDYNEDSLDEKLSFRTEKREV